MKNGPIIERLLLAGVLLGLAVATAPASGGEKRVDVLERPAPGISLPPLAVVSQREETEQGRTWRESGEISGPVEVVRLDFIQVLRSNGWKLDKTIVVSRTPHPLELAIWLRPGRRVLLMLWEKEAGLSGFAWGDEQ